MKTTSTWNIGSIAGKLMMGFVLAAMIGGIGVMPSFGEEGHDRNERGGRGNDRDRYEQRGRGYARGHYKQGRRPVYRERVYVAPPPVVYAPPEPPGVSIFLPPIIFR